MPILAHYWAMERLYFDTAATTAMGERPLEVYREVAQQYIGNPSSLHKEGRQAANRLAEERALSARLLGVEERQLFYTSGATESNAIILTSLLWKREAGRVLMSALEHSSVNSFTPLLERHGFEVITVKTPGGYLDYNSLERELTPKTQLVCITLVSNLLGTLQDLPKVVSLVRRLSPQAHIHCDAAQAIGKVAFSLDQLGVDSASFSGHKFRGPRGAGLLYLKSGTLQVASGGGGQEGGIRGGTEALPSIAALNVALEESLSNLEETLAKGRELHALFVNGLSKLPLFELLSPSVGEFTPFIITISLKGFPGEVFSRLLYDRGFCLSIGSACSSNSPKVNKLLFQNASFTPSQAEGSLRISFDRDTTQADIMALLTALKEESEPLKLKLRK